ncbi:hypothetical protein Cob_v007119 [Colletotrichum orbiculare MAFF 240422]|uniref:DUF985 domain-containing protein n=1 Tax=Colletotrichum orbiculare (strain 104-T / ATCC 96160 / CBS 514.97 / LARS 414 / MAFF 240422) TaxID=1213857 RepID=N4V1K8_COLOR|nr:hypothetical protein Cob_v007119 [Colletotrichum orbiculare MAFF 240422]
MLCRRLSALAAVACLSVGTLGSPKSHSSIERRSAQEVIERLGLEPNVEKGYYVETFEDPDRNSNNRSASTAIYYLLEGSDGPSTWHRVDAAEVWHHYAGAPLTLSLSDDNGEPVKNVVLGPDIFDNQQPQVVVAKNQWQRAASHGRWTLVGTTVAPGFSVDDFQLAEPDWVPKGA